MPTNGGCDRRPGEEAANGYRSGATEHEVGALLALISGGSIDAEECSPGPDGRIAALIAILGLFTAFEVSDLTSRFADISGEDIPVSTSYGAGLWLIGIGVVAAAAGWFRMPWSALGRDTAPAGL